MRVVFNQKRVVCIPENDDDLDTLVIWKEHHKGAVFGLRDEGIHVHLENLGLHENALRKPINVTSGHPDPTIRLISNFAETQFILDEQYYASVEGFWQSLKFDDPHERRQVATLASREAFKAGRQKPYGPCVHYGEQAIPTGTWGHWQLMRRACEAKFKQHQQAREALVGTGQRRLVHQVRRDSKTIPGVIMAEIWMEIRAGLHPDGV